METTTNNPLPDLAQFYGTEHYYRLTGLANFKATDGVKYVAENAGAYWLVDAIASYQPQLKHVPFQFWKLSITDNKAVLTCTNGDSDKAIVTQMIPFTDFPLPSIEFYLTDNVLMLPSEY